MTPALVALAAFLTVALFLTLLLHRLSRWTDPELDEEYSRIDEAVDARDSFVRQLEQIRSLPSMAYDPERLHQ